MPYLIAFLFGSIPFGWIIARSKGVDIKKVGSGNIGATNVYRALGKSYGLLTLIMDLTKGIIPMALFLDPWVIPACVLGHCFTPLLLFRGGKGVSTLIGVTMPIYPFALVVSVIAWYLVHIKTRIVALASITLTAMLPLAVYFLYGIDPLPLLVTAGIVVLRHLGNIRRLARGEEPKSGFVV